MVDKEPHAKDTTQNYKKRRVQIPMKQAKLQSFYEAKTNAVIGLLVSFLFTLYGLPLFGLEPSPQSAAGVTACYFVLSFARSYVLRRLFNRWAHG